MVKGERNLLVLAVFFFFFLFALALVSAEAEFTFSQFNSTFGILRVDSADKMYSYDVSFDILSGTGILSASFTPWLVEETPGVSQTTGFKNKDGIASVYASRLDNSKEGRSGSGFFV